MNHYSIVSFKRKFLQSLFKRTEIVGSHTVKYLEDFINMENLSRLSLSLCSSSNSIILMLPFPVPTKISPFSETLILPGGKISVAISASLIKIKFPLTLLNGLYEGEVNGP